jgi:hypothetical protein
MAYKRISPCVGGSDINADFGAITVSDLEVYYIEFSSNPDLDGWEKPQVPFFSYNTNNGLFHEYLETYQIDWLTKNTDCQLYFISRQTANWEDWCIRQFQKQFNLSFTNGTYKYLTCPNECDDTCWQTIIYNGNKDLLTQWKKLQ